MHKKEEKMSFSPTKLITFFFSLSGNVTHFSNLTSKEYHVKVKSGQEVIAGTLAYIVEGGTR